jgi:hypothetical protein
LHHDLLLASPINPLVFHYKRHIGSSPGLRYRVQVWDPRRPPYEAKE